MKNATTNLNSIYIKAEILNPTIKALRESNDPAAKQALAFFEENREKEAEKQKEKQRASKLKKLNKMKEAAAKQAAMLADLEAELG
jgi:hypothetical protein